MVALLPRPFYVRGVRAPHELDAFAVGYERVSGYRVPRDYLALAEVFVAKRHGRVVGGFALMSTHPSARKHVCPTRRSPDLPQHSPPRTLSS